MNRTLEGEKASIIQDIFAIYNPTLTVYLILPSFLYFIIGILSLMQD
jgi:hypothetical protein